MYESLLHIDKSCIFRETFNSAFDVANNRYARGVVSATGVKFDNGVAKLDGISGYLNYPKFKLRSNTITIVFNLREVVLGEYYLFDNTNRAYIYYGADGHVEGSSTVYVNGTPGYLPGTVNSSTRQIVGVFNSIKDIKNIVIGKHYSAPIYSKLNLESIEIYNRVLSALEIKLLYQSRLYLPPSNLPLLLDFDSTRGVIEDRTGLNRSSASGIEIRKIGKCYSAYPKASAINFGDLNYDLDNPFVLSIWAKQDKVMSNFHFYWSHNNRYLRLNDSTITLWKNVGYQFVMLIAEPIRKGVWGNMIIAKNADNSMRLYGNGKFDKPVAAFTWGTESDSNYFKINGNLNRGNSYYPKLQIFKGILSNNAMDDFASQLYNSQKGAFGL